MIRVAVDFPPSLETPEVLLATIHDAARTALDSELPSIMGEIAKAGLIPRNRGTLQRAVVQAAQPARIEGTRVSALIFVAGEASQYADVMDAGRRAGKPMRTEFLLYGPGTTDWRTGWVNRRMRSAVVQLATALQAAALAKRKTKGRKLARGKFERSATFLLARSIARKIQQNGIAGRAFISGKRTEIRARCAAVVNTEIGVALRRAGYGGA